MSDQTPDQIREALASPLYNPDVDVTDATIYNMMSSGDSDEVIQYYTDMINNLPTSNVYAGVLQNPHTCDIEAINNDMNDLNNAIVQQYNNYNDPSNPAYASWQQAMDYSNPSSMINQLNGTTEQTGTTGTSVQQTVNTFSDHTDRMVSNFPSILGIIQTALGIAAALEGLLNPCLGLSNFLSSLLAEGKTLLAQLAGYIKTILQYVEEGLEYLVGAIAKLFQYAQQIMAFIENEILQLVKAIIAGIKFGLSSFLKALGNDPCASALLSTVATAGAAYAIGTSGI